ncbi:MAG: manganese efflux pump, partial [Calditrichia bacterium]
PVLGWLAGKSLAAQMHSGTHIVAFLLLSTVGAKMIYESTGTAETGRRNDPTRGLKLISLSIATSIDALAAGISLAFLEVSIIVPALIIGVITIALTLLGMGMGARLGLVFRKWLEKAGGIILILIGINILLQNI